ncbi:MAG: transcriptional regulator GcvA [Gammaproteobacteria bacterium]
MLRRLPSLNALRAFEAAGRLLSLTKAAEELHVTPAAVGHQVKSLEDYLGQTLFERRYRSIALTGTGRALLPGLTDGFDRLADTIEEFHSREERRALTVTAATSFASKWLVPRLDQFRELHPEIDVRLDATQRVVDIAREGFDLAIRFGTGEWPALRAERLLGEEMIPVGSPELLARKPVDTPEDLSQHTLLHLDPTASVTALDWKMWLRAAGVTDVDAERGPSFSMESMAIQSAIEGHGVALVSDVLAAGDLESGKLVRLFDLSLRTGIGLAYYLVYPENRLRRPRIAAFREWILAEVGATERQTRGQ